MNSATSFSAPGCSADAVALGTVFEGVGLGTVFEEMGLLDFEDMGLLEEMGRLELSAPKRLDDSKLDFLSDCFGGSALPLLEDPSFWTDCVGDSLRRLSEDSSF